MVLVAGIAEFEPSIIGVNTHLKQFYRLMEQMMNTTQSPIFIPLSAKWFDAFEDGTKNIEYRRYGARWNERTCYVGREAILSRGYGKKRRLMGVISRFEIVGPEADPAILDVYPDGGRFAAIYVEILRSVG